MMIETKYIVMMIREPYGFEYYTHVDSHHNASQIFFLGKTLAGSAS